MENEDIEFDEDDDSESTELSEKEGQNKDSSVDRVNFAVTNLLKFQNIKKNQTLVELRKEYRNRYAKEVLPSISAGRRKIIGWMGQDIGWYEPDEDRNLQMIDAMYDLFECLNGNKPKER